MNPFYIDPEKPQPSRFTFLRGIVPERLMRAMAAQDLRLTPAHDLPLVDVRHPDQLFPELRDPDYFTLKWRPYPGGVAPIVEALGKGLLASYPGQVARLLMKHGVSAQPTELLPYEEPPSPEEMRLAAEWFKQYLNEKARPDSESYPEFTARNLAMALGGRIRNLEAFPLHKLLGLNPGIAGGLLPEEP